MKKSCTGWKGNLQRRPAGNRAYFLGQPFQPGSASFRQSIRRNKQPALTGQLASAGIAYDLGLLPEPIKSSTKLDVSWDGEIPY